jgi:hypothetical protein
VRTWPADILTIDGQIQKTFHILIPRWRLTTPESYVVDTAKSGNSVGGWSPFDGMTLPYRVAATYVRGRLAYDGTKAQGKPEIEPDRMADDLRREAMTAIERITDSRGAPQLPRRPLHIR